MADDTGIWIPSLLNLQRSSLKTRGRTRGLGTESGVRCRLREKCAYQPLDRSVLVRVVTHGYVADDSFFVDEEDRRKSGYAVGSRCRGVRIAGHGILDAERLLGRGCDVRSVGRYSEDG